MTTQTLMIDRNNNLVTAAFQTSEVTGLQMMELTAAWTQHMRYDNVQFFVLDMTGVMYMDSSCLGALVTFMQDLEHVRGRIALANCHDNVAFLFRVTRLNSVFRLYDSLDDAQQGVKHG
jgi:anti-sigma B factor antagonist